MTPLKWLLLVLGGVALVAYTLWWYRTREEPVRGRGWAAALRSAALILIWLLVINPTWPAGSDSGSRSRATLLDASISMSRPLSPGGGTLWTAALDSLEAAASGVWLFGGSAPTFAAVDSLPEDPGEAESRLAPALRAAALAGATAVSVVTDGELTDERGALEEARRLGLGVEFVLIMPVYGSRGITEVRSPGWVQSGDSVHIELDIQAMGSAGDTTRVEVVDDRGRVGASAILEAPRDGRIATVPMAVPIAGSAGMRRLEARFAGEAVDPEPRDDSRAFYVRVAEGAAGPVLISLRPDWEPSFLMPSLDRVTEGSTRAYYWLTDGLLSLDGFRPVPVANVQKLARAAPLLVIHGYGADAPQWAQELVERADRILIVPAGEQAFEVPSLSVRVGAPRSGEWYASDAVPPSPIAPELVGFTSEGLPPLTRVRPVVVDAGWSPLLVRRMRRGEESPAVVVGTRLGRRWAVATAEGYWRWAFRPGSGRQLYRALWTGLAGWLTEGRGRGESGLEPSKRVVQRGDAFEWGAPASVDSLTVEVRAPDGSTVAAASAPTGEPLRVLAGPGRYDYVARAFRGDRAALSSSGPLEVEEYTRELAPGNALALDGIAAERGRQARAGAEGVKHLAALGWPYLVLIALFAAEWILRRRVGLR